MHITANHIWGAYTAQHQTPRGYTVALEWCGYPERRHVVRLNGAWRGTFEAKQQAQAYINSKKEA